MKRLARFGAVIGASLLLLAAVPVAAERTLDRIVAVVGDGVILESELQQGAERVRRRLGADARRVPPNVLRSQVLDQLILQRLQTQRANRAGIQISRRAVDSAIAKLAQQNNMSQQQFLSAVRGEGLNLTQLRERVRQDLLVNQLRQRELASRLAVTEEDVDRYLESEALRAKDTREYHIRHILIAVSDGASTKAVRSARQRAENLRQRAVSGETAFADLAIAQSDGQKALEGGDMGWLAGGFLPSLFSEIVPKMGPDEISPVFRGPSGFHLIKLAGVRNQAREPVAESVMVEEIKARHIMLSPNEIRDDERTAGEIQRLHQRLRAGDDFAELARSNSDDATSANQGGDLGWVEAASLPRSFAEQLTRLDAGATSEPFRSRSGWHIIQVQDRRTRDRSEERRRERARQALGQRKLEEETDVWIRKLRDEAYVDIRMENYTGS